jgi:hypothetical protein
MEVDESKISLSIEITNNGMANNAMKINARYMNSIIDVPELVTRYLKTFPFMYRNKIKLHRMSWIKLSPIK